MPEQAPQAFERFRGKRGLVMGLGVFGGGVESARFLARHCDSVIVTDLRDEDVLAESVNQLEGLPIEFRLGKHDREDFLNADVVIHSPAVRPDNELLRAARDGGAEVTMEMSLFIEACPATTIGITGSNGKTTTALLAYEMLCEVMERAQPELEGRWADPPSKPPHEPRRKAWLGGNCGQPLLNHLGEMSKDDVVVLELSSFQLQDWHRIECSCDIAAITNITPNHLDWHSDFAEYLRAKCAVYQYGARTLIRNGERPELADLPNTAGIQNVAYSADDMPPTVTRDDLRLPGRFNWSNAMAAWACARATGLSSDADLACAIRRFRGVEHRLESCGEVNGARCYNDSIATTPESTMAALSAFEGGIHLLLGGSDKGLSFDGLARAIADHAGVRGVYVQGVNAGSILDALEAADVRAQRFDGFDAACDAALSALTPGDVLLMSPASASFYEYAPSKRFSNFEHRGRHFKDLVKSRAAGS